MCEIVQNSGQSKASGHGIRGSMPSTYERSPAMATKQVLKTTNSD